MPTSAEVAISVVKDNLHEVFEEVDPSKRKAAIERLWVPSGDAILVNPNHVSRGHDEIDGYVAGLVKKFAGWVFVELGVAQVIPETTDDNGILVVRQEWRFGPPGEEPKVLGQDIATMEAGRIKLLYAIIAPPSA